MTGTRGCVRDNEPDCIDSLVVQAVVNQHEKKTRICACDWFIVFLAERPVHPRRAGLRKLTGSLSASDATPCCVSFETPDPRKGIGLCGRPEYRNATDSPALAMEIRDGNQLIQ